MNGILERIYEAVLRIENRLDQTDKLIKDLHQDKPLSGSDWLTLEEFCSYHPERPAKSTVYSWVHNSEVPFHKKGKRLLFLKSEIQIWLLSGRKSAAEKALENIDVLLTNKSKRKGKTNGGN